jgi:hypothetical protein
LQSGGRGIGWRMRMDPVGSRDLPDRKRRPGANSRACEK